MLSSVRFWAGIAVTAVFLTLLVLSFDFAEMREALADANYVYLVPAVIIYFGSLWFRSFRWSYVLRPFVATRTTRLFPVVLVGYMANNVLPMRLGEFARSYYLSTREPVRGSTALATIVIERVFDGLTLLLFLAAAAFFLPVTGLAERVSDSANLPLGVVAVVVIAPFVGVLSMMVLAALYPEIFLKGAVWFSRFVPAKYRESALDLIVRFLAGFEGLHRPHRLFTVLALSLPIWLIEGTMYYLVALGFDIQDQFESVGVMIAAMLVLTSVSNLATSIPSSQGSVGPFEFFATLSLVFLGVGTDLALAYAIVLHAALLLPVVGVGLLHLAMARLSLGELTRGQREEIAEGEEL